MAYIFDQEIGYCRQRITEGVISEINIALNRYPADTSLGQSLLDDANQKGWISEEHSGQVLKLQTLVHALSNLQPLAAEVLAAEGSTLALDQAMLNLQRACQLCDDERFHKEIADWLQVAEAIRLVNRGQWSDLKEAIIILTNLRGPVNKDERIIALISKLQSQYQCSESIAKAREKITALLNLVPPDFNSLVESICKAQEPPELASAIEELRARAEEKIVAAIHAYRNQVEYDEAIRLAIMLQDLPNLGPGYINYDSALQRERQEKFDQILTAAENAMEIIDLSSALHAIQTAEQIGAMPGDGRLCALKEQYETLKLLHERILDEMKVLDEAVSKKDWLLACKLVDSLGKKANNYPAAARKLEECGKAIEKEIGRLLASSSNDPASYQAAIDLANQGLKADRYLKTENLLRLKSEIEQKRMKQVEKLRVEITTCLNGWIIEDAQKKIAEADLLSLGLTGGWLTEQRRKLSEMEKLVDDIHKEMEEGLKFYERREFQQAAIYFKQALEVVENASSQVRLPSFEEARIWLDFMTNLTESARRVEEDKFMPAANLMETSQLSLLAWNNITDLLDGAGRLCELRRSAAYHASILKDQAKQMHILYSRFLEQKNMGMMTEALKNLQLLVRENKPKYLTTLQSRFELPSDWPQPAHLKQTFATAVAQIVTQVQAEAPRQSTPVEQKHYKMPKIQPNQ